MTIPNNTHDRKAAIILAATEERLLEVVVAVVVWLLRAATACWACAVLAPSLNASVFVVPLGMPEMRPLSAIDLIWVCNAAGVSFPVCPMISAERPAMCGL